MIKTPKPNSNIITRSFIRKIPTSPYNDKIKIIKNSVSSNLIDLKTKYNYNKYLSSFLPICNLILSGCILTFTLINPYISSDKQQFQKMYKTSLFHFSILNTFFTFSYVIIKPSHKYILYKEIIEGLELLDQSIDHYLCKPNKNEEYENYIAFNTCEYKLLKKINSI